MTLAYITFSSVFACGLGLGLGIGGSCMSFGAGVAGGPVYYRWCSSIISEFVHLYKFLDTFMMSFYSSVHKRYCFT